LHDRESSALQYAMHNRLIALGWSGIETVDDNLGCTWLLPRRLRADGGGRLISARSELWRHLTRRSAASIRSSAVCEQPIKQALFAF
jgi:hypothetical protein